MGGGESSEAWAPKKTENALFHYSQKMAQIIEEDLGYKLEDLDFDKDPY
jgi:hypothetical protein